MVKKQLELIYPSNLIKEPIIYQMAKSIDVIFNVRRARVTAKIGEIVLELEANDEKTLDQAVQFLTRKGVTVEPVTHTALES
jgi:L-aspartate semialdehyde sulfurtransferase ferredoxin